MGINFGNDAVNSINFRVPSSNPGYIVVNGYHYRRYPDFDGHCSDPQYQYSWITDDAHAETYVFTQTETPAIGDSATSYGATDLWNITDVVPDGFVSYPVYAVQFNNLKVWGVKRHLNVYFDSGFVYDVTVTRDTRGYEPVATGVIQQYTPITGGKQYDVYPGDVITITASPMSGDVITGGTGTFTVSIGDGDINKTVTGAPEELVVTGSLYRRYDEYEQQYYYHEEINLKNNFETSTTVNGVTGSKIYTFDSSFSMNPLGITTLQARSFSPPSVTGNYQVTISTSKGNFVGNIINSL